jgi:hypothetical protein
VFWSVEGQTGLYVFFKTVCDLYDLLPAENYKLPPEAEGLEAPQAEPEPEKSTPTILKAPQQQQQQQEEEREQGAASESGDNVHSFSRTNTRRHIRSSPSTGSAVTTVMESAEEEDTDGISRKVRDMHLSAPDTLSEEPETADVPMMVEDAGLPRSAAMQEAMLDDNAGDDAASEADQTVVDLGAEEEEDSKDEGSSQKEQEDSKGETAEDQKNEQSQEPSENTDVAAHGEAQPASDEIGAEAKDEPKNE